MGEDSPGRTKKIQPVCNHQSGLLSPALAHQRHKREGQHPMNLKLAGKVAIVTGGASGIGAAVCCMLAEEGVKIAVADRKHEKGRAMALEIHQRATSAKFVAADV